MVRKKSSIAQEQATNIDFHEDKQFFTFFSSTFLL